MLTLFVFVPERVWLITEDVLPTGMLSAEAIVVTKAKAVDASRVEVSSLFLEICRAFFVWRSISIPFLRFALLSACFRNNR